MRIEQDIFDDIARLCSSPGYVHVIAHLCFRDNMVGYADEMKAEDLRPLLSTTRLIRTEISTLIGLLIKQDIDYTLPDPSTVHEYLDRTEALLEELHHSMSGPMLAALNPESVADGAFDPFSSGEALREPIFYGGESAYSFQYRDFSARKYSNDDEWLIANMGFSIGTARDVVCAVQEVQTTRIAETLAALRTASPDQWTLLPGFIFSAQDIADHSCVNKTDIEKVLAAFAVSAEEKNDGFRALSDFNVINAHPIIRTRDNSFLLLETYSLTESLYDSPFYWMCSDDAYRDVAMKHRGRFTEEVSLERLALVFGKKNVYSNVDIVESKRKKLGEIDVLVLFGNRAIVLQAKSKRLTLEARKGNDGQIRDDFKKAIQNSYDQANTCAKLLIDGKHKLVGADAREIAVPSKLKEIYIFCVISDHYPALSFQTRQFLKYETPNEILPPFVMDVFTIDVMTEMLQSPLRLLSYAHRRVNYSDLLHASHELTILSFHLRSNLWFDNKHDMVMLADDFSADLDVAMAARRDNVPGERTPDGVLTRFRNTCLGRFVQEIEARPDPSTIDFGFMLLTLSEDTVVNVSKGIEMMSRQVKKDGKGHDLTISLGGGSTGLTIHCNDDPIVITEPRLRNHCELRKYTENADSWFGVCISPENNSLRFGLNLNYKWEQSAEMDAMTSSFPKPKKVVDLGSPAAWRKKKIGRNEPCPCGSGLKYKKCCMKR
jgi:hypothetical protein